MNSWFCSRAGYTPAVWAARFRHLAALQFLDVPGDAGKCQHPARKFASRCTLSRSVIKQGPDGPAWEQAWKLAWNARPMASNQALSYACSGPLAIARDGVGGFAGIAQAARAARLSGA